MCCGRTTKSGATIVWQHILPGQEPKTYATEGEAQTARARAQGVGVIVRTTQPPK